MTSSAFNSALYYRQQAGLPFAGRSDRYLKNRSQTPLSIALDEAIQGIAPYDVTGVAINEDQRDEIIERLKRYNDGHLFYGGDQFVSPYQDGELKTVFNFCKVIVDKGVNWHEAKGWKIESIPGNEEIANYLNYVWAYNNRGRLSLQQSQFGAITGDSYFYVTARTVDQYGNALPRNKWTVRIQALNPRYVYPIWSNTEVDKMKACFIQMPVASSDERKTVLLSIWITPAKIMTWEGTILRDEIENPLGEVNVVHVPNFELSGSRFGQSDIEDVIPINEQYNAVAHSTKRIIQYCAEPTTIIYGVRASQLEKGVSSVWSGLPETAKVENLELKSDLNANFKYMEELKHLICEMSQTPKIAFDGTETIPKATSSIVIELCYQPLLEKTRTRQICHAPAIAEVNRLIMRIEQEMIGAIDLPMLADTPDRLEDTTVTYTTPLPRDEAQDLDLNIKKFNAGVISQAELMRCCSNVTNLDRLILEVLADKRAMLMEAYETQRATNGERPNSLSTFIGSQTLSMDVQHLAEEIAALEKVANNSTDALVNKESTDKQKQQLALTGGKPPVKIRIGKVFPKTAPKVKVKIAKPQPNLLKKPITKVGKAPVKI